jgi:type IV pilus secretin PilQ/predicted competence protein
MRISKSSLILVLVGFLVASCVSMTEHEDEGAEEAVRKEYLAHKDAAGDQQGSQFNPGQEQDDSVAVAEEPIADSVLESTSESNASAQAPGEAISEDAEISALLDTKDAPDTETAQQPEPVPQESLTGPVEPEAAPVEVFSLPTKPVVAASPVLHWIGYNYVAKDGTLVVDLQVKGSPPYSVFQETNRARQPELVVRLFGTKIRRPIRRPVDASEFRSPVSFIRTRTNPKTSSVDVILTLREEVQPKLDARDTGISLTYRIPDHWYGLQKDRRIAKATPSEVAEPLDKANLYPVFEPRTRMPDVIDAKASDVPSSVSIPPQGAVLHRAGGVWLVGKDNGFALDEMNNASSDGALNSSGNATVTAPANTVPSTLSNAVSARVQSNVAANQLSIATVAGNPGADLLGTDHAGAATGASARKINLDFRGAPLSEVIKAITDKSGVNFIYAGAISSIPVSIQLQDIAWDVAFKSILDLNALGLVRIANNLYRVDQLANIAKEREQIEAAKIATQRLEPTRIMFLRLSYAQAGEAVSLVSEMLGNAKLRDPRIQIRAEQRTNSLIVEAPARELARVKTLVERIDLQTPQVKIESRVVEVVKTLGNSFGISWGAPLFFDQSRGLGFGSLPFPNFMRSDFAVEAGGAGSGVGSMNFLFGSINNSFNLDLHLRMSESEGLTETLQTNSVIVQNNQGASISGGQSDVFVLGSSAPGTAPQVLSVDYTMNVGVTPTVTADGAVRMTVNINSSSPSATIAAGATSGRYSRNISTVLLRRSGETAVIGGLNTRERSSGWVGIPILSRIPIIGALFRNSDKKQSNRELLLMVTPTILNVAQSTGEGGSGTFDDSAGAASDSSPDKLDTSGTDSEFRAEDVENASTSAGNMANLVPEKNAVENNATGDNNATANALDAAVNEINSDAGGSRSQRAGNNSVNDSAKDAANDSANDALGNGKANNSAGGNDAG